MEKTLAINFQNKENTGCRGFPAVDSHKTSPKNSPAVYPMRISPRHRAKLRYSHT